MNRFSILYKTKGKYHQMSYATRLEADTVVQKCVRSKRKIPIGIYDAKTELFSWTKQVEYNQLPPEQQGKKGNEMILIVQHLRAQEEQKARHWEEEEDIQFDVLLRPLLYFK